MSQCRSPLDICALRLSRLNANGSVPGGHTAGAVSLVSGIGSLKWTAQYFTTPDIAEPDGCGNLAVIVPPENLLKRYDVELDFLIQSDELHEIGYGASLVVSGATVIGHAVSLDVACGTPAVRNGVVVEGWAKNWICDEADATYPYRRVAFSKVKFSPADESRQRGPNHLVLKGSTFENSTVGNGPFNDFPSGLPSSWSKAEFNDTALPTASTNCGYVTLPSQS